MLAVCGSGTAAEEFTFKRLKPPQAGTGRFITVQIDPEEQARRLAMNIIRREDPAPAAAAGAAPASPPPPGSNATPAGASYAWYWDLVPAGIAEGGGRFDMALAALTAGPGGAEVRSPRLQTMQDMAQSFGTDILKATIGTQVSPALVLAVMGVESAGRSDAVSPAGAQGLMQLIPATAERFGVGDSMDPAQNIRGGVDYLDWLMTEFNRDPVLVLAAYNAGEGAVRGNQGVPPYAETRDYVPKVLAAWQVAQGLCLSQPLLITDPCVFNVVSAAEPVSR